MLRNRTPSFGGGEERVRSAGRHDRQAGVHEAGTRFSQDSGMTGTGPALSGGRGSHPVSRPSRDLGPPPCW